MNEAETSSRQLINIRRGCGRVYRSIDNQTPQFMASVIEEKHRAKLAKNGEDTH